MIPRIIVITGGIGSGKSVVSDILRSMGLCVYDCDTEAKRLMSESCAIRQQLCALLGRDAYSENGELNKIYVAHKIFYDNTLLEQVNSIVHPVVKQDILAFAGQKKLSFVEAAVFKESSIAEVADVVWVVEAPSEMRIQRVMRRNNVSRQEVETRINSQCDDYADIVNARVLLNDDISPLLPQIEEQLKRLELPETPINIIKKS